MTQTPLRNWTGPLIASLLSFAVLLSPVVTDSPALLSNAATSEPYTPAAGTPERKAIYDAMRKLGDINDRIFVVKYLRVQDGWAWTAVEPQSPDGKQHYEPESALLHKQDNAWKVVDQPCAEEGCDIKSETARIRSANPNAPAAIFPKN